MPRKVSLIVVSKGSNQFDLYGEHGRKIFSGDRAGTKWYTEHRQTGRVIEAPNVEAGLKAINGQKRHQAQAPVNRMAESRPRQGGGVKSVVKPQVKAVA